ncbi:MAG TPA: flagellar export chaperone FliS [Campylobacterales bacterium]|nr:flagellar export chaperone FliS [Campylobacterales bacterium]
MRSTALNAYAQNAARIESPEKLVQMLFEGILRFTAQAKKAIEDGDIEKKVYWLNRSIDIFAELINSLNYEKGGEVANYLNGLYSHQIYLLSTANLENTTEPLDTVISVTKGLIDAWKDVTGAGA